MSVFVYFLNINKKKINIMLIIFFVILMKFKLCNFVVCIWLGFIDLLFWVFYDSVDRYFWILKYLF